MSAKTQIIAARAPDGVRLTMFARDGNVVIQTTLSWRQAMLLGLDLVNLATEPLFRLEAKSTQPRLPRLG
jgi:hypothetical protein